jgi:hypothetical protein
MRAGIPIIPPIITRANYQSLGPRKGVRLPRVVGELPALSGFTGYGTFTGGISGPAVAMPRDVPI